MLAVKGLNVAFDLGHYAFRYLDGVCFSLWDIVLCRRRQGQNSGS